MLQVNLLVTTKISKNCKSFQLKHSRWHL